MLESLCLIPVDYYFFYYYYYSKVAISTFPHICLGTELEREIKQQQKSYNLKENKKGNVHPLVQVRSVLEGAQSAFLLTPFSCSDVPKRTVKQLQENLVWHLLKLLFLKNVTSFPQVEHPSLS